jgi:hypothetical protein
MFCAFFRLAMIVPARQRVFRWMVAMQLCLFVPCLWWTCYRSSTAAVSVSYLLLTAGIIEGAILIGWRLTQMPKSRALEFLFVSPVHPSRLLLVEALIGLGQLVLVTLAGLPCLVVFVVAGFFAFADLLPLLLMPMTWGGLTGVGLTFWAYESHSVRRWGERLMFVLIFIYLVVGALAGEHLGKWIEYLPKTCGLLILNSLEAFHRYNPFAVMRSLLIDDPSAAWQRFWGLEIAASFVLGTFLCRAASRLKRHFHDRHYRPAIAGAIRQPWLTRLRKTGYACSSAMGDQPLAWWAVKRVSEYSGRVNLWLAGGFGLLYAVYTIAGTNWPSWLGRGVFQVFDNAGGVPIWAAALTVLAAVPAAFQYGLWDSNAQDRCRRLELLLLTKLDGMDYWRASLKAAWQRGRGYFVVALVLWGAGFWAGCLTPIQCLAGLCAGIILWALYFTLGFRSFARGREGSRLGLLLTVGLPLLAYILGQFGWNRLAALLPPGSVFYGARLSTATDSIAGPLIGAVICLIMGPAARASCDTQLRSWYGLHHGSKLKT